MKSRDQALSLTAFKVLKLDLGLKSPVFKDVPTLLRPTTERLLPPEQFSTALILNYLLPLRNPLFK
jgi:hypothetical protein